MIWIGPKMLLDGGLVIVQGLLLVMLAPLIEGVLRWLERRIEGAPGPRIAQPYYDLKKLLQISGQMPLATSSVTRWTPRIVIATSGALAFLVPLLVTPQLWPDDLILIILMLTLARSTLCLAGIESGSGFSQLGAAREIYFSLLGEIGLFGVMIALALPNGTTDLSAIVRLHANEGLMLYLHNLYLLPVAFAFALLILIECGRMPIDNPYAHAELGMGRRAIAMAFAGRDLALLELAEQIKLTALLALFAALFGIRIPPLPGWLCAVGYMAIAIVALALLERLRPRLQVLRVDSVGHLALFLTLLSVFLWSMNPVR